MSELPDPLSIRNAYYPIEELILKRWSPRACSGELLSDSELMTLFEAARWAPSTYNEQEWRFVYAKRDTEHWDRLFGLLFEANQVWCAKASHLVVVISRESFTRNDKPNAVHSFDTGAAFQNLCLQATAMNLVSHGMGGFDRDKARSELSVPEGFNVEAMIALGKPGSLDDLPEELKEREVPTQRKSLKEIAAEGVFSFKE